MVRKQGREWQYCGYYHDIVNAVTASFWIRCRNRIREHWRNNHNYHGTNRFDNCIDRKAKGKQEGDIVNTWQCIVKILERLTKWLDWLFSDERKKKIAEDKLYEESWEEKDKSKLHFAFWRRKRRKEK